MNENESGTPFEDFLRSILGDEAAAEAARALEAQGFDPANLPPEFSDPARMQAALGQFQFLMNTTAGPVNWRVVEDSAKQAAYMSGDQAPTATEAEAARQAMTIADLWLDAVTDFASGPVTRDVWSKVAWVEHTIPTWKRICEPIALNVSRALSGALSDQFGPDGLGEASSLPDGMAAMLGKTQEMMPRLSAMMFSAQLARALAALAGESFGTYDTGIPLSDASHAVLLPHTIAEFADGLDVPFDEVRQFLAVREAAHRRLFASVPWLEGDLVRAVERYASQIAIDTEAITEVARSVDPSDPESVESALSGGVVDAVTTDDITLAGLAATKANKGKLRVVGSPFTTERYGVGLPKGTDKCEAVNNAINEMVADGTWEKLITKYTEGTGYHYNTETNPPHLGTSCA